MVEAGEKKRDGRNERNEMVESSDEMMKSENEKMRHKAEKSLAFTKTKLAKYRA